MTVKILKILSASQFPQCQFLNDNRSSSRRNVHFYHTFDRLVSPWFIYRHVRKSLFSSILPKPELLFLSWKHGHILRNIVLIWLWKYERLKGRDLFVVLGDFHVLKIFIDQWFRRWMNSVPEKTFIQLGITDTVAIKFYLPFLKYCW